VSLLFPGAGLPRQGLRDYKDKVNLVFKDFPLEFHKDAKGAHNAALCAQDQGKFWEFHDVVFKNQQKIGAEDLKKYATDLSLDMAKFNACVETKAHEKTILANAQEGQMLASPAPPVSSSTAGPSRAPSLMSSSRP